jgi:hypothetical protein
MDWVPRVAPERAINYVRQGIAATKAGLPYNLDNWGGYPAARARLWCLAGALLPAALIAWLRYSAVLDFGCETWQHETCGIFFRCARCVHVLQNLYWLARARLYSSPGSGVLVGVLAAVMLVASSCVQRTQRGDPSSSAAEGRRRAPKSPSTVPRWILVQLHASSSAKFPSLSPITSSMPLRFGTKTTLCWLHAAF